MKHHHHKDLTPHEGFGDLQSYITGFVLSIILTVLAYILVTQHVFSGWTLLLSISGLASIQAIVQLIYFLHLGAEKSPAWNLITFLFMFTLLVVLVSGTLWIMYHLNYAMGHA